MTRAAYEGVCRDTSGGPEAIEFWLALWDLLADRQGWYFDPQIERNEPVWCYGVEGACRLALTADPMDRFVAYIYETDSEEHFSDLYRVKEWLTREEPRYAGYTPLQEELMASLLIRETEAEHRRLADEG